MSARQKMTMVIPFRKSNKKSLQVALDLRRSNLRRLRITPILKPGDQKVEKKKILLLFMTFYNFSRTASYTKS